MNEKLTAGLVTAAIISPLCAFCILGPAVFISIFAGLLGWLGGINPVMATGSAIILGILVFAYSERKIRDVPERRRRAEPLSMERLHS